MAQDSSEQALPPNYEENLSYLENMIMAPCCWRPVAEHDSGAGPVMKGEIERRLKAGHTPEQIIDAFVNQSDEQIRKILEPYGVKGEEILAKPRVSGFNITAYIMPVVLVFIGIGIVSLLFKRLLARQGAAGSSSGIKAKDAVEDHNAYRDQIDDELAKYDF